MKREEINEAFGVTEKQLDAAAQEFEEGAWTGSLGLVVPGRPDEPAVEPNQMPLGPSPHV